MPTALTDLPLKAEPQRKLWTRAEYQKLSAEMLGQERLELVCGELISKMGKKRAHVNAMILLQAWLVQVFGLRFVHPEAPIDVEPEDNPSSEPEPDIIVTRQNISHFEAFNPRPADLLLVVEIADTTLGFDLKTKARLYARAGIAEYWVLDVCGRRLIVHRDPRDGQYGSVAGYEEAESVAPLAAPASELRVENIFIS
ncbi:MAG: Uma2 family endonuclease [Bryobacteraceae bacterium]|nr:Uma2 family endonuclease [Bryobacteraceae bacterium]